MPITVDDILTAHRTGEFVVMGILNVTPDSFSDGGKFLDPQIAIDHARKLAADGADILDIGPESTRPGSQRVADTEQIERLSQILPEITELGALVSIDTTRAKVAEFALSAGAELINDVSAGRDDDQMLPLAASTQTPIVLMHMLGEPKSMQENPTYTDVVAEVKGFLRERLDAASSCGINLSHCIVDPGIGFGKLLEHNLSLLRGIPELLTLGCPVLIGPSRKRFIGELTGESDPERRLEGTLAACLAARRGGASIFRVHDVAAVRRALLVADAIDPPRTVAG